ncbi:hypothetical protein VNI00_017617 [Paramarasmius palmivorus]|uniref:Uncharacterized protein n=1 Tax=Paramarasmius palmivorus TaxID=297713 RepID=A0AAW0B566_9AGAR
MSIPTVSDALVVLRSEGFTVQLVHPSLISTGIIPGSNHDIQFLNDLIGALNLAGALTVSQETALNERANVAPDPTSLIFVNAGPTRALPLPFPNLPLGPAPAGTEVGAVGEIPPDLRWYAVIRGLRIGVLRGHDSTSSLVSGVPRAMRVFRETYQEAVDAFVAAVLLGNTAVLSIPFTQRPVVNIVGGGYVYPNF